MKPTAIFQRTTVSVPQTLAALFIVFLLLPGALRAQISGPDTVCQGEVDTFNFAAAPTDSMFLWTASPGVVLPSGLSLENAVIQWGGAGDVIVSVQYLSSGVPMADTFMVHVSDVPSPDILASVELGCVGSADGGPGGQGRRPCEKYCDSTTVRFYASGAFGSTYSWNVLGPASVAATYPGGDSIDLFMGALGNGLITLTETTVHGCVGSSELCYEIIEEPVAVINSLLPAPNDTISICLGQLVVLFDSSYVLDDNALQGSSWYIDGAYAGNGNPFSENFNSPGVFQVNLVAINTCGCADTASIWVNVDATPGPIIEACVGTVCEFDTSLFHSPTVCSPYSWSVEGSGNFWTNGPGDSLWVVWDSVGPSGYGLVCLDGDSCPGACPYPTCLPFPVLTNSAEIAGPSVICRPLSGFLSYTYSMPAWPGVEFNWSVNPFVVTNNPLPNELEVQIFPGAPDSFFIYVDYSHPFLECTGQDTLLVFVRPEIAIAGPQQVCLSSFESWCAIGLTDTSGYSWYVDGVLQSGDSNCLYRKFDTVGTYLIEVSHPSACNTAQYAIQVLAPPPAPDLPSGDTAVCIGFPASYSGAPSSGLYYLEWHMNDGPNWTSLSGNTIDYTWTDPSGPWFIALVQIQAGVGCVSDSVVLNISEKLPDTPVISGPDTVCANSMDTFSLSPPDQLDFAWSIASGGTWASITDDSEGQLVIEWNNTPAGSFQTVVLQYYSLQCDDTVYAYKTVVIAPIPQPDIQYSGSLCEGNPISFSQGNPAITSGIYSWDFGDGGTAAGPTATHTYNSSGTFFVELSVTDPNGCIATVTDVEPLNINPEPVIGVSLAYGSLEYCLPAANEVFAVLTATNQSNPNYIYQWCVDGDTVPGSINVDTLLIDSTAVTFSSPTTITYTIKVTDTSTGCSNVSDPIVLEIDSCEDSCRPQQGTGVTASFVRACNQVVFNGVVLPDTTAAVSFGWFFDDFLNPPFTSAGTAASHTYTQAGIYYPEFSAVFFCLDSLGNIDSNSTYVREVALAVAIPAIPNFDVQFECDSNGQIVTTWLDLTDFVPYNAGTGNGTNFLSTTWTVGGTSYAVPPTTLPPGTYPVSLKKVFSFQFGPIAQFIDSCTVTDTIVVPAPATAAFSLAPDTACEGTPISFTDLSTPAPQVNSWNWDFGDGSSSLLQNPTRTYDVLADGSFQVVLSITDDYGCVSSDTQSVFIYNNELGGVISVDTVNCGSAGLSYLPDPGSSSPVSYYWSDMQTSPTITVTSSGFYLLTVSDVNGCQFVTPVATVDIPNTPFAFISGPDEYCQFESIELFGTPGADTYQWEFSFDSISWFSGPTTSNYTTTAFNDLYLRLIITYTDPQTLLTCEDTSARFDVTVHPLPPFPNITVDTYNCDLPATLTIGSGFSSGYSIIWSNGTSGSISTQAYYYGYYEVEVTDSNGCSNSGFNTLQGPHGFGALPTGCYEICDTSLPDTIGVNHIFLTWEWIKDGVSFDTGSLSAPELILADSSFAGDWQLVVSESLNGKVCYDTSDLLKLIVLDCDECTLDASLSINDSLFCRGDTVVFTLCGFDWMNTVFWQFPSGPVVIPFSTFYGLADSCGTIEFVLPASWDPGDYELCLAVSNDPKDTVCVDTICVSFFVDSVCCKDEVVAQLDLPDTICEGSSWLFEAGGSDLVLVSIGSYLDTLIDLTTYAPVNAVSGLAQIVVDVATVPLPIGTHTICVIAWEDGDSTTPCTDTLCQDIVVIDCGLMDCDTLGLLPFADFSVVGGMLQVTDFSVGPYDIVEFEYNGNTYTGAPGSSYSFPLGTDFEEVDTLCISICAIIDGECCKVTECYPVQITCEDLNLSAGFDVNYDGNGWTLTYNGHLKPDGLIWTLPDSSMVVGAGSDTSVSSIYYNGSPGWVHLQTLLWINDSVCCLADTSILLSIPSDTCKIIQGTTNILVAKNLTNPYNFTFGTIPNIFSTYTVIAHSWNFGDGTINNTAATPSHTYSCTGSVQTFTVSLTIVFEVVDAFGNKTICDFILTTTVSVPPCANKAMAMRVFPNPSDQQLNIQLSDKPDPDTKLELRNGFGAKVHQQQLTESHTTVPIGQLPAGVYMVVVRGKRIVGTEKVIIVHQ